MPLTPGQTERARLLASWFNPNGGHHPMLDRALREPLTQIVRRNGVDHIELTDAGRLATALAAREARP